MQRSLAPVLLLWLVAGLPGCATDQPAGHPAPDSQPDFDTQEIERLDAWFEARFQAALARSPQLQATLGIKDDYDKWDDISDARARDEHAIVERELEELRGSFDPAKLDSTSRLSYELFEYASERELAGFEWRFHSYPVNQMFGLQSRIPAFLINIHRISSQSDAQAYIARLRGIEPLFEQLAVLLDERARLGIVPPKFVFPYVIQDCRNILTGEPFDDSGEDSTLLADFRAKVLALDIPAADRQALVAEAERALVDHVGPAYRGLLAELQALAKLGTDDDGVWKHPDGERFYAYALRNITTTDLTAAEIHALGLAEVDRIHAEMRAIMAQVGFEGDLADFFVHLREDPRYYYPDTDEGRQAYLARVDEILAAMTAKLGTAFDTLPNAELVAKRVESFREKSAGKAFYSRSAPDGSRPGVYYANLYDMRDMPRYEAEALVYHEGLPGHHMQIAIAGELEDIPRFRRIGGYTAFIEGWGLYSEFLGKEMGFYQDPYSDFGRLAMELWRACRLVVDTGIHQLGWTREEAIDYLLANTSASRGQSRKAIERYIVMPAQATAYKIGMLRILAVRQQAHSELGDRFELRRFHDTILRSGALPLPILENVVADWVAAEQAAGPP